MRPLNPPSYRAAHTYLAHLYEYPPPPPPWDFNPMSHDTCKNFHQDSWVAFKWNNFVHFVRYYLPSSQEKMKTMLTCIFFLFLVGGGCNQGVLWEMCKWRIANTNRMQFHWIFYLAVRKMEYNPPLKSQEIDENGLSE